MYLSAFVLLFFAIIPLGVQSSDAALDENLLRQHQTVRGGQLLLIGKRAESLEGTLNSESKEVFQGGNDEAKYKLKLVRQ